MTDEDVHFLCACALACARVARGVSEFYPTVRENVSDFDSFVPRRRVLSLRLSVYVRACVCLSAIPVSFSY